MKSFYKVLGMLGVLALPAVSQAQTTGIDTFVTEVEAFVPTIAGALASVMAAALVIFGLLYGGRLVIRAFKSIK